MFFYKKIRTSEEILIKNSEHFLIRRQPAAAMLLVFLPALPDPDLESRSRSVGVVAGAEVAVHRGLHASDLAGNAVDEGADLISECEQESCDDEDYGHPDDDFEV